MLLRASCWMAVLAITIYGLKQYINGGVCENKNRLEYKVALITGGTSGLGKETAKVLAERGAKVYITCRTEEKGQEVAAEIKNQTGRTVFPMILDLASVRNIREFTKNFKRREKKLHILINNAGVFHVNGKTEDGFEIHFGVNHLGHFLLTNLLIDEMATASEARIITLSSMVFEYSHMNWKDINNEHSNMSFISLYGQSKIANILFTRELARRLKGTNISAYSLHPGNILTGILRNYYFQDSAVGQWIMYIFLWPFTKDVTAGVQTTLCLATDTNLVSGKYYRELIEYDVGPEFSTDEDARRLWELSVEMLQMKPMDIHPLLTL